MKGHFKLYSIYRHNSYMLSIFKLLMSIAAEVFYILKKKHFFQERYQSAKRLRFKSGLTHFCVQTVCKDYKQTTKVTASNRLVLDQ